MRPIFSFVLLFWLVSLVLAAPISTTTSKTSVKTTKTTVKTSHTTKTTVKTSTPGVARTTSKSTKSSPKPSETKTSTQVAGQNIQATKPTSPCPTATWSFTSSTWTPSKDTTVEELSKFDLVVSKDSLKSSTGSTYFVIGILVNVPVYNPIPGQPISMPPTPVITITDSQNNVLFTYRIEDSGLVMVPTGVYIPSQGASFSIKSGDQDSSSMLQGMVVSKNDQCVTRLVAPGL